MISPELQKEIESIPEFSGLELSPPMTIKEVAKSVYVNWEHQILMREFPWRAWALMNDGLTSVSVRARDQEGALKKLKIAIKTLTLPVGKG